MPLYEYSCDKCKLTFELNRGINDASLVKCPTCNVEARKLVSSTSFQLKGTGWYKTDYQNKGKNTHGHSDSCGCCANNGSCNI